MSILPMRSSVVGRVTRTCVAALAALSLAACVSNSNGGGSYFLASLDPETVQMYGAVNDGGVIVPAINVSKINPRNFRRLVDDPTGEEPGTIVVDPEARYLYLVMEGGQAMRYSVGVGKAGMEWKGSATIRRKGVWPSWTPTPNMIERDPERYAHWAHGMEGGLRNPLGARALYLYDRNGNDTLYRIHGTNEPWSIGRPVSSGCIRLFNQDIMDLYKRVPTGTRVVVL